MGVDPVDVGDKARVADAFEEWLRTRSPAARVVRPLHRFNAGLETATFRCTVTDPPWVADGEVDVVLRVHVWPSKEEAVHREFAALEWAREVGFAAPLPFDAVATDDNPMGRPFLVESVVAGKPGPLLRIGRAGLAGILRLADLQLQLHALSMGTDCEVPEVTAAAKLTGLGGDVTSEAFHRALAWTKDRAVARTEPVEFRCVVHLDLHPGNVLRDAANGRSTEAVIDWSCAGVGDPHADVARTIEILSVPPQLLPIASMRRRAVERRAAITSEYVAAYERQRALDPERLRFWQAVHVLDLWAASLSAGSPGAGVPMGGWVSKQLAGVFENRWHELVGTSAS